MEDLREIFNDFPEGQLLSEREEMDYIIILEQKQIPSSSLIPEKSQAHEYVKMYLNEMLEKEWIRTNSSPMGTSIFLVSKKEGKRPVINY